MSKKLLFIIFVFIGLYFVTGCSGKNLNESNDDDLENSENETNEEDIKYVNQNYVNTSEVLYSMEVLGYTNRNISDEYLDEGLERYPTYNQVLTGASVEEKEAIIKETNYLRASSTTYDSMDKDGNLYLNGQSVNRKLYKHTASDGNYAGNVSDEEKAVIKRIKIIPNMVGTYITGLYAAPGEVISIAISDEDLELLGGSFNIVIGQKQQRNTTENNIWSARDFVRMPLLCNTMAVKATTSYVGSFLGGPIYIDSLKNVNKEITITISGAVEYHHYIHGLTSEKDFERTSKSSAPFFELAVIDNCVRHNGPKKFATKVNGDQLSFDDCYQVSEMWMKISKTSRSVPSNSSLNASISFLYDPFVAAGAAVAFQGLNWVNCPLSWFSASLDYDNFMKEGSWGNIHEYNHHFQAYGLPNNTEVSNNATSLISYALYTNISANRDVNDDSKLSGWNRFTDPSRSLRETLSITNANYTLSSYADLLHSFGSDIFIAAAANGAGLDTWYKSFSNSSQYDLTYYFENILHLTLGEDAKREIKEKNYPIYIPVATTYQTARGHIYDGKMIFDETLRPYEIENGKTLRIDFSKDLILPSDFSFTIKSFQSLTNTTLKKVNDYVYEYNPNDSNTSEKLYLTIELKSNVIDEPIEVVLQLEFVQKNKELLKTTYQFDSETKYSSVAVCEALNFKNANNVSSQYIKTSLINNLEQYSCTTIEGKIFINQTAKYRVAIRGGDQTLLYIGVNNNEYKLAGFTNKRVIDFNYSPNCYSDYNLNYGDYLYFKIVILANSKNSFAEIGMGKFIGDNVEIKSVDSNLLLNQNTDYKMERFTSKSKFPYTYSYTFEDMKRLENVQIIESLNSTPWDNNYTLDKIFDQDINTSYHSKNNVTKDNPFQLILKLDQKINFNSITFVGYNMANNAHVPVDFEIYAGDSLDDMQLICEKTNAKVENTKYVTTTFNNQTASYIKIVVSRTNTNKYIALSQILIGNIDTYNYESPDCDMFYYSENDFSLINTQISKFGHSYIINNGKIKFNFSGEQFILSSLIGYNDGDLDIIIDGVKENIVLDKDQKFVYKSKILDNKEHNVTLVINKTFVFESLLIK